MNASKTNYIEAKNNVYFFQNLALAPLRDDSSKNAVIERLRRLDDTTRQRFLLFLLENGLACSWVEALTREVVDTIWQAKDSNLLFEEQKKFKPVYLKQIKTLLKVSHALDRAGIAHAYFKGVHTREVVYTNPTARQAGDLDLLIEKKSRTEVIDILTSAGFSNHSSAENLTHELTLSKDQTFIDLHWHILRPGRVSRMLTTDLLARRIKADGYWSLADDDHLFVLLVHPVFSKYSSMTQTGMLRFLDILYWLQKKTIDWDYLIALLDQAEIRSAAWITFEYMKYIKCISDKTISGHVLQKLQPGKTKSYYLRRWIASDLAARLERYPFIVKICFTLHGPRLGQTR
ncbi:nucleotidyltransferase family protein [Desulfofustis glycolicus]|uniref:Uncharacterized nucleotidyltransferase n=1 Tax=Desulfofustis glycolicus DSM 9705 TaxID=1121409 RepID=A0A1M5YLG0_9BACT|nr:nucleotidyltransferase family protein [Desulfofustis glycolicus]SHI12728.1 Uncharacterised nucleotidyltransferase [Desulfofustis glycolicus DSM 9705]